MKTEKYVPLCKQVRERVKLLDHMCHEEFKRGIPTSRQEWLLVFEALQEIYGRLEELDEEE